VSNSAHPEQKSTAQRSAAENSIHQIQSHSSRQSGHLGFLDLHVLCVCICVYGYIYSVPSDE
jgi:hypothetical protein